MKSILSGVVLLCLALTLFAQDPYHVEPLSQTQNCWTVQHGVAVNNHYAYLADHYGGIRVVDVAQPESPAEVGFLDIHELVQDVACQGDYLFATGGDFMAVYTLSDPAHPQQVARVDLDGYGRRVVVTGYLAYLIVDYGWMLILDITDPTHPAVVFRYPIPTTVYDFALSGNLVALANWQSGVILLDVAIPTAPVTLATFPCNPRPVAIRDSLLLVGDGDFGLRVVNISDPSAPVELGQCPGPRFSNRLTARDDVVYMANSDEGLTLYDIGNPGSPQLLSAGSWEFGQGVAVQGETVFLTTYSRGFHTIDVGDPAHPEEIGYLNRSGSVSGVAVSGDRAYLAMRNRGITCLDISDPAAPVQLGAFGIGIYPEMKALGDTLYALDNGHVLHTIDFTDPSAPVELGSCPVPGIAYDMEVRDGILVALTANDTLLIIDVSEPANPRIRSQFTHEFMDDVVIVNGYLYVGGNSLLVIDVRNPDLPTLVNEIQTGAWSLIVDRGYLYYLNQGLRVMDLTNPVTPQEVASYGWYNGIWQVAAEGGLLFLGGQTNGFRVVNMADPLHPYENGFFVTPGYILDMAARDGRLYIADMTNFGIYDCTGALPVTIQTVTPPSVGIVADNTPNPFNPVTTIRFSLPVAGRASVRIYNARGQMVRTLVDERLAAGKHSLTWNGDDDRGKPLSSGVYLYRIESGGDAAVRKALLMK